MFGQCWLVAVILYRSDVLIFVCYLLTTVLHVDQLEITFNRAYQEKRMEEGLIPGHMPHFWRKRKKKDKKDVETLRGRQNWILSDLEEQKQYMWLRLFNTCSIQTNVHTHIHMSVCTLFSIITTIFINVPKKWLLQHSLNKLHMLTTYLGSIFTLCRYIFRDFCTYI